MEKPRIANIETLTREESRTQDFWIKVKEDFDLWAKDYKAKIDYKFQVAQTSIERLENQKTLLAREVVRLRKINAQIGELLGMQRTEKR